MNPTVTYCYEPRPRDFALRQKRARSLSLRAARHRKHLGRRAAALLAAVAVPAFAAPDDWSSFTVGATPAPARHVPAMPFETPGASFPGSAFYYLASNDIGMPLASDVHSDAEDARPAAAAVGPSALALRVDNSGVDRGRALQCLTAAIYYEAASEPDAGQRAVAQVVLNRVAHPAYPDTICGVVYQGSERRTGCQFSFTCDGSLARTPSRMFWLRAENVARAALAGYVYAPVGLATHYHTVQIHPYWADSLAYRERSGRIGSTVSAARPAGSARSGLPMRAASRWWVATPGVRLPVPPSPKRPSIPWLSSARLTGKDGLSRRPCRPVAPTSQPTRRNWNNVGVTRSIAGTGFPPRPQSAPNTKTAAAGSHSPAPDASPSPRDVAR